MTAIQVTIARSTPLKSLTLKFIKLEQQPHASAKPAAKPIAPLPQDLKKPS